MSGEDLVRLQGQIQDFGKGGSRKELFKRVVLDGIKVLMKA